MRNPGGAGQLIEDGGVQPEDIRDRELELWNLLLNHEGRRELAIDHWNGELTGHAMALARLQIISVQELNEMLDYADAAYSYVIEQRDTLIQSRPTGLGFSGYPTRSPQLSLATADTVQEITDRSVLHD